MSFFQISRPEHIWKTGTVHGYKYHEILSWGKREHDKIKRFYKGFTIPGITTSAVDERLTINNLRSCNCTYCEHFRQICEVPSSKFYENKEAAKCFNIFYERSTKCESWTLMHDILVDAETTFTERGKNYIIELKNVFHGPKHEVALICRIWEKKVTQTTHTCWKEIYKKVKLQATTPC